MNRQVQTIYRVGSMTLTVASNMAGGRWHGPFVDMATTDGWRLTVSTLADLAVAARRAQLEAYRQADQNTLKNSQIVLAQGRKA